jgi:hypothetical protein
MKIAKDLLKIAHELDANGLYDLADTIDYLAVKLAKEPSDILAPPKSTPAPVDLPKDFSKQLAELAERDSPKGKAPGPALAPAKSAPLPVDLPKQPVIQPPMKVLTIENVATGTNPKTNPSAARSGLGQIVDKAKAYRANPANSWTKGIKGANPGMLSGFFGGAVGGHAGGTIGGAIGGETGAYIGSAIGGIAGAAISGHPAGRALLAGWAIGTVINNIPGVSDAIQGGIDSIVGNPDAEQDELQLKGMLEILPRLQLVVDNASLPLETRVKKLDNLRSLISKITQHPAADKVLGDDGVGKLNQLGTKIDQDINAAVSAPDSTAPAGGAPAVKEPRKVTPSPAIRKLQENLNKLHARGSIQLNAPLAVDGIVGPKTRAALIAFDPTSGGRVTTYLVDSVSASANYQGGDGFGGG